ncbi:hypothetical protein T265_07145 [Opisthorchis viverrini]|uniref:Uncharacterized protein n=1 Tax=Opisthorchis viverrini TaxID=6198 RepID=A0A074ZDN8_OPIVI|nr:hypothetical protein T265_07145 [Opisthorchis viverrini]KER25406.1 hypothetical protein T265_07145 [Opisthorchis viverrini]
MKEKVTVIEERHIDCHGCHGELIPTLLKLWRTPSLQRQTARFNTVIIFGRSDGRHANEETNGAGNGTFVRALFCQDKRECINGAFHGM